MKIIIAVRCFSKRSVVDVWQGSDYASVSKCPRVLIAHDSEYVSGSVGVRESWYTLPVFSFS